MVIFLRVKHLVDCLLTGKYKLACFKATKLRQRKEEILNLIWLGLPTKPDSIDPIENDRFFLFMATMLHIIQQSV